ncbi:MAG: hypothetical protein J2P41_23125, partial [Blastocatellia bacterium]|nr:hypothetical protein [Blastocatellia bacterium]
ARSVLTQAPSSYRLPYIYWPYGIETAQSVKQAGLTEICVPDAEKDNWQAAGFKILTDRNLNFEQREKLIVPGILRRANIASPTSRPWIEANGWRFIRNPAGKYYYELPAGKGALAAAEAFAYGVDAVLKIDQSDLEEMGKMLAFQRRLPQDVLPVVADIGVIDDQTPLTGEVMNLLTRRNLLFKIVAAPSSEYAVNIKIGTSEFPESDAADPSSFAQKIRRLLTDEKRTLRIYGNEVVICRLTGKGSHLRLQLLNYSGREIDGMRVRLLGSYRKIHLMAFAYNPIPPEDMLISEGATEFTIPKIGTYTQVELDN